jgi:hypothetical protein
MGQFFHIVTCCFMIFTVSQCWWCHLRLFSLTYYDPAKMNSYIKLLYS